MRSFNFLQTLDAYSNEEEEEEEKKPVKLGSLREPGRQERRRLFVPDSHITISTTTQKRKKKKRRRKGACWSWTALSGNHYTIFFSLSLSLSLFFELFTSPEALHRDPVKKKNLTRRKRRRRQSWMKIKKKKETDTKSQSSAHNPLIKKKMDG